MVTITWTGVKDGVVNGAKWVKDTTVKYVGGKTLAALGAGLVYFGGHQLYKVYDKGAEKIFYEAEFKDLNGDNALDLIIRTSLPLRDGVLLQQLDANGQPNGKFVPSYRIAENQRDSLFDKVNTMKPEAESHK